MQKLLFVQILFQKEGEDKAGKAIASKLKEQGIESEIIIIPDEPDEIRSVLNEQKQIWSFSREEQELARVM